MSLSLQSLPSISVFTDQAIIGMLKSYAGIYRDNKLLAGKDDFRLSTGIGAFSVNMIFGIARRQLGGGGSRGEQVQD